MNAKLRQSSTIDKWRSFHCAPMIRLVFMQSSNIRQQYKTWQDTNHLNNGNETEEDNEAEQRECSSTECRELHFGNLYFNSSWWSKKILMNIVSNILELSGTLKVLNKLQIFGGKTILLLWPACWKHQCRLKKERKSHIFKLNCLYYEHLT